MADPENAPQSLARSPGEAATRRQRESGVLTQSGYVGLSESARLKILATGALIACINLLGAWYVAHRAQDAIGLTQSDVAPYKELAPPSLTAELTAEQRHDLLARSIHLVALTKSAANKQGIILAAFGGAFALGAIGFALFVIGADGAFKVSGTTESKAKVVISGTAPGLLCFVVCGGLIYAGVRHQIAINLPSMMVPGAVGTGDSANDLKDLDCLQRNPKTDKCVSFAPSSKQANR